MSIIFYYGSGSPFAWRVWFSLEHKALDYDLKTLSFTKGETRTDVFTKLNPHHRVPVIQEGDFILYESIAIVEYLEDRFPDLGYGPLFPSNPQQRALARRLILEADHYFYPWIRQIAIPISFLDQSEWDKEKMEKATHKIFNQLKLFAEILENDFFAGESVSAVDYTLYPMMALLYRIEKRCPDFKLTSHITPNLLAWMKRIEALSFFKKTYPPHWK